MNIRKAYKNFTNNRLSLIIVLLIFIAMRIPWMDRGSVLELGASALIQIGIALLLVHLAQKYAIIRQRTLLPAFFYLLLVGTNSSFFYDLRGSVSAFLVLLCLLLLFDTYQNSLSQPKALNIALVLTLGSFYWTPLLLFFPLFWYGMYRVKSLNFKTFFASVLGFAVVCLFLFAWSIYRDDCGIFMLKLLNLCALWDFRFPPSVGINELVADVFLGVLFIISVITIFMSRVAEKAQARTFLGYLSILTIVVFILSLGQPQWEIEWMLILYVPLSLLLAHYFTLSQRLSAFWLFLLTVLYFLSMYALQWIFLDWNFIGELPVMMFDFYV